MWFFLCFIDGLENNLSFLGISKAFERFSWAFDLKQQNKKSDFHLTFTRQPCFNQCLSAKISASWGQQKHCIILSSPTWDKKHKMVTQPRATLCVCMCECVCGWLTSPRLAHLPPERDSGKQPWSLPSPAPKSHPNSKHVAHVSTHILTLTLNTLTSTHNSQN